MFKKLFLISFLYLLFVNVAKPVYAAVCSGGCQEVGFGSTEVCAQSCQEFDAGFPKMEVRTPLEDDPDYKCWIQRYGQDYNSNQTCSCSCSGGGSCTEEAPSKTILKFPTDKAKNIPTSVTLKWNPVSKWGIGCPDMNKSYKVFVKEKVGANCSAGGYTKECDVGSGKTSCLVNGLKELSSYCWYVKADNGSASTDSDKRVFYTVPGVADINGWIWDSTDKGCGISQNEKKLREIGSEDVERSFTPIADGVSGTWDPGIFESFSFIVQNVTRGVDKSLCATPIPKDKPNFKYVLSCLNNSTSGVISGSCASLDILEKPTKADLGYKLVSKGWFTSLNGDVYGGCAFCSYSVSNGIPNMVLGGFKSYLINGIGTVFGGSDLSIKNALNENRYSEDSNRFAKNIGTSDKWLGSFTFLAPNEAIEITDCNNFLTNSKLSPEKVYKISLACAQAGINSLGASKYKLKNNGIVVIYVDGTGSLRFRNPFLSTSDNKRLFFVVLDSILVDKDLGVSDITLSTRPHIEAGFVAGGNVKFASLGDPNEDLSVVVEGPVIAKNSIIFDRDRKSKNGYPAEVVKYNSFYLEKLTEQEAASSVYNYSGLMKPDIRFHPASP